MRSEEPGRGCSRRTRLHLSEPRNRSDHGEGRVNRSRRCMDDLLTPVSDSAAALLEGPVVEERLRRPASSSAMIVFEDVRKIYEPDVVAVDGVSFVIDKGEFVFVVGPSGSGKSTIIRLLLKELEPTSGRILVGGRDLNRLKRSKVPLLRRNVGCVFQDFKLLRDRSAFENIAYALRVQGESSTVDPQEGAGGARARRPRAQVRRRAPTSSRAASSSASRSRAPSSTTRRSSSATSRPGTSTPTRRSGSCSSCTASTRRGRRS